MGYLLDNQGFESGSPDTYMSGWDYEYLQDLSYHAKGWKYEYVTGTFSELMAMHEAGQIDLMSNISYTPERAEKLLYSTNPSGKECYYIYVKSDRDDLTAGDPQSLQGKTIGVNPGVQQTESGKKWLADEGIDVRTRAYPSCAELEDALGSGEVDTAMPFARDYWLAEQGSFTQSDSLGETALVASTRATTSRARSAAWRSARTRRSRRTS